MEEMATAIKCYLRSLRRQLLNLQKAIKANDFEEAEKLIDELVDDTQRNIEE